MDWERCLPLAAGELAGAPFNAAREVRARAGQPLLIVTGAGEWRGKTPFTPDMLAGAARALTDGALTTYARQLSRGFAPLKGGHRLGVGGRAGAAGMEEIYSLCVRVAREIRGAGAALYPFARRGNLLIIGAPGTGKTTALRDVIRLLSDGGEQVAVADERGEIAAFCGGTPAFDIGARTDVIADMQKADALPLLVRALSPRVLATDEIGAARDAEAILDALRCGVRVVATAHGRADTLAHRRFLRPLLDECVFDFIAEMPGAGDPPRVLSREELIR